MSVFVLKNNYMKRKGLPLKACLLGASFLVGVTFGFEVRADETDGSSADVFTSWIDESALRAKVSLTADDMGKADEDALQTEAVAEATPNDIEPANDNFSPDLLAAVDESDVIQTVEVAVVDRPLYSPAPSETVNTPAAPAVVAAADTALESPASPNDYKKYGSAKSPWVDPSLKLSDEEMAIAMGDMNAYLELDKPVAEPIAANPQYGKAFGNEQDVRVMPIASTDKILDDVLSTPKTMASSQMHSDFDDKWNDREEAASWLASEANAAELPADGAGLDFLNNDGEGDAGPDWLAGAEPAAIPAVSAGGGAGVVAEGGAAIPPAPVTLSAELAQQPAEIVPMVIDGNGAVLVPTPAVPSQPLLVPMDTVGVPVSGSGDEGFEYGAFGSEFGYDNGDYGAAYSYSQGSFAPAPVPAPMPLATDAEGSGERDMVDTVKDWFGSIISSGEDGKRFEDAVSRYTQKNKKVEKATSSSQIRISFEKGSSDISADTVKWLKSFAAKAAAEGRNAAEVTLGKYDLRLQSRRFALVRNVLLNNGFDAENIKPSLNGTNVDEVVVNTSSPMSGYSGFTTIGYTEGAL